MNHARLFYFLKTFFLIFLGVVGIFALFLFAPLAAQEAHFQITARNPASQPQKQADEVPKMCPKTSEFELCIPKTYTVAPIQEGDTKNIFLMSRQLQDGVVHLFGSANPREQGNMVIFGHSDDFFWKKGNYKTVFSLLDRLAKGDPLFIWVSGELLRYEVEDTRTISPNDLSVLDQNKNGEYLTLITCWPPGTTLQRYAVLAKRQIQNVTTEKIP